ncbi:hypothetical protein ACFYWP_09885 [Actinacidiphila glaucinigra]|uniref:hypothetical protein n=1 Tax=Actinacidiphila glaucinigra TaxID=235986 RepID=UPI0036A43C62
MAKVRSRYGPSEACQRFSSVPVARLGTPLGDLPAHATLTSPDAARKMLAFFRPG